MVFVNVADVVVFIINDVGVIIVLSSLFVVDVNIIFVIVADNGIIHIDAAVDVVSGVVIVVIVVIVVTVVVVIVILMLLMLSAALLL